MNETDSTAYPDIPSIMQQLIAEARKLRWHPDADLSLLWSAGARKQEMLQYLLAQVVKNGCRTLENMLYQAAEFGDRNDIQLLVNGYGADAEYVLRHQTCVWYTGGRTPSTRLFRWMEDMGYFRENPHYRFFRKTFLSASLNGWTEWVKLLLERGVDVNCRHVRTHTTPLMSAIQGGQPAVIPLLLKAGANPLAQDACGRTAMMLARVRWRIPALREYLLAAGVPDEAPPHVSSPRLMDAVERHDLAMARYQLENGADVNYRSAARYTPLMAAAERGFADMVRLFLHAGAEPTLRDRKGNDALTRALNSPSQDEEVVRILRAMKAHPVTLTEHSAHGKTTALKCWCGLYQNPATAKKDLWYVNPDHAVADKVLPDEGDWGFLPGYTEMTTAEIGKYFQLTEQLPEEQRARWVECFYECSFFGTAEEGDDCLMCFFIEVNRSLMEAHYMGIYSVASGEYVWHPRTVVDAAVINNFFCRVPTQEELNNMCSEGCCFSLEEEE